jgi:AcrR family transcriptional regulator
MSRTSGSRNRDYDTKREELLKRLGVRLTDLSQGRPSFRELAAAAGISVPTLRHYFKDRDGVLEGFLDWQGRESARFRPLVGMTEEPFARSIRRLLSGASFGLADMNRICTHVIGLTEGLHNGRVGPRYLQATLEPLLAAVEQRLTLHVARGEMRAVDLRHAAVSLVSPLLLAILHQRELGGSAVRRLELERFIEDHADGFVRAYSAEAQVPAEKPRSRASADAGAGRRRSR